MSPVLESVGLSTAQGSASELLAGATPLPPAPLPWPAGRRTSSLACRPAQGIGPHLSGRERWQALARRALAECCGEAPPAPGTPLLIASCNGAAGSFAAEPWRHAFDAAGSLDVAPWEKAPLPVVSAACASGLQALFLAAHMLAAGVEEAVVLAVDILSAASHLNLETLRILSPGVQPPWQPGTEGFLAGEAAVALRLRRNGSGPRLLGPVLGHDLRGAGGLGRVLDGFPRNGVGLVLGQGTGPAEVDAVELAALRRALPDLDVPLTTPLYHFGHTLGSSGLLSLALAVLAHRRTLRCLRLPVRRSADGRRLADPSAGTAGDSLVVCRALGGACAAAAVTSKVGRESPPPAPAAWAEPMEPGPLHHPLLRRLAAQALAHRPAEPPEMLVVRLSEPLRPPARAVVGGRLLPSAVLELTPGFAALLIARAWGYTGPTLGVVGRQARNRRQDPLNALLANSAAASPAVQLADIFPENLWIDWNDD